MRTWMILPGMGFQGLGGDESVHWDDSAWGFRVSSFGGDDRTHLDDLARHGGDDSARHLSSGTQAQPLAGHSLPELIALPLQPHADDLQQVMQL